MDAFYSGRRLSSHRLLIPQALRSLGEHRGFGPQATPGCQFAIRFHIETFGSEVLPDDSPVLEAFIAEATLPA